MMNCAQIAFVILIGLQLVSDATAQLSDPIAHDANMETDGNKFLSRHATDDAADKDVDDEEPIDWTQSQCSQNLELRWMRELSSSIYATPLITDLYSDGMKEVVSCGFVHQVEVVEGATGEPSPGWPASHTSSVHASPMLLDIDRDGVRDVMIATYSGELLFFNDRGEQLSHLKLVVPRLRVRKNWFAGLDPDWVDHTKPDVHDPFQGQLLQEEEEAVREMHTPPPGLPDPALASMPIPRPPGVAPQSDIEASDADSTGSSNGSGTISTRHLLQEQGEGEGEEKPLDMEGGATVEEENPLSEEAVDSWKSFNDETWNDEGDDGSWNRDFHDYGAYHPYQDQYEGYDGYDGRQFWDNEEYELDSHPREDGYLYLDAHILCNPVLADLDKDGREEVVVAVSYFFDREYYESYEHRHELGEDVDLTKYVAGGIVVFDTDTMLVRWSTHLDLTTDTTQYRAYMYSTPSVADLDGDGTLEVVVGTSVGFIYALNGNDGSNREGFPIQMGEVQGQVVVNDVNDDGFPEIVGVDTRGNVGVFNWKGKELWEVHLRSLLAQGPTVGDVNGDGATEIVVPTASGYIHVLNGKTGVEVRGKVESEGGKARAPFPFRTHGRVMSPVLIVRLHEDRPQQHLVVLSFDGFLYAIDGATGCADTVDIGETSYSMVLADDLDGDNTLDLLVSTMNGNLYAFQTPARYHPLKTWPQQVQGFNGLTARHGWVGVAATHSTRNLGDLGGDSFVVQFEITDNRPLSHKPLDSAEEDLTTIRSPYEVTVRVQSPGHDIEMSAEYSTPGTYALTLPVPRQRLHATVSLMMTDSRKMSFVDSFVVSFHMHVHRMLKWMLALPFLVMCAVVLSMRSDGGIWRGETSLPSHLS